jgi:hypothetical protein
MVAPNTHRQTTTYFTANEKVLQEDYAPRERPQRTAFIASKTALFTGAKNCLP